MRSSRSFQVLSMVYRERYREPTLELVVPTMLVSNVFLVAFYERFGFQLLGVVLAFVPLISVSETLAFSLGLRNLIFVTGEHLYDGSMISFLTYPLRRETLFFFIYISDVVLPLLMWVFTTLTYSMLSGVEVPSLLYLTFVAGYLFSENLVLLIILLFRSPGVSTLLSLFLLGGIFVFGGAFNYYQLVQGDVTPLYLTSFLNPFVLWIAQSFGKDLTSEIVSGVVGELALTSLTFLISFLRFRVMEV